MARSRFPSASGIFPDCAMVHPCILRTSGAQSYQSSSLILLAVDSSGSVAFAVGHILHQVHSVGALVRAWCRLRHYSAA
jgi:hypothetical protein